MKDEGLVAAACEEGDALLLGTRLPLIPRGSTTRRYQARPGRDTQCATRYAIKQCIYTDNWLKMINNKQYNKKSDKKENDGLIKRTIRKILLKDD